MMTTPDQRIEHVRETVCDLLGVVRDSLVNPDLRHTDSERGLLISLAAQLVLQASDNNFARVDDILASIRRMLEADYPQLARAS